MAVPSYSPTYAPLAPPFLDNSSQHFIRLLPLFLYRQSMTITLLSLLEPSKQSVLPCQFPLMQMPVLLTSFAAEHLPGLYFQKSFLAVSTSRHSFASIAYCRPPFSFNTSRCQA